MYPAVPTPTVMPESNERSLASPRSPSISRSPGRTMADEAASPGTGATRPPGPARVMSRFDGLMSRCAMRRSCSTLKAAASERAATRRSSTVGRTWRCAISADRCSSVPSVAKSITRYGLPSSVSAMSRICTTCGSFNERSRRASCTNRPRTSGSHDHRSESSFTATGTASRSSWARYTVAKLPAPNRRCTTYRPPPNDRGSPGANGTCHAPVASPGGSPDGSPDGMPGGSYVTRASRRYGTAPAHGRRCTAAHG